MASKRKALIVGAGPAGLSAAISLSQAGYSVDILERTDDRLVLGSELHIQSAALRALDQIGAADYVVARGVPIERVRLVGVGGETHADIPLGKVARSDLPASVGITRGVLHSAIYESAAKYGVTITHGVSVADICDDGLGVRVFRTDGIDDCYDFVVAADGVSSRVRQLRFPNLPSIPPYSGQCVWRASVPRTTEASLTVTSGKEGVFAGLITVSEEESYLFCLASFEKPPRPNADQHVELIYQALSGFGGQIGEARDLIDGSRTLHFSPMWAGVVSLPWTDGRTVLTGDACHATTPHLGYGAGLAIEDGVVLGKVMSEAQDVASGLQAFVERRFERCSMVVDTALRICKWQQSQTPGFNQAAESTAVWKRLAEPI